MAHNDSPFPAVNPGGSLVIAWRLKDKHVLLVGGGQVASTRLAHLLDADALVTIICPKIGLHPLLLHRIYDDNSTKSRIDYHDRIFAGEEDLNGMDMVLTAIDNVEVSKSICLMCRARRIPVNVADVPPECDFYFGSMIRRGPLQVMVSTGGKGPKIANLIRVKLEEALPDNVSDAIERVGELRAELRKRAPGVGGKLGQRRMDWMTEICQTWTLDELGTLDETSVAYLLDHGWAKKRVPSYNETRGKVTSSRSWVCSAIPFLLADFERPQIFHFAGGLIAGIILSVTYVKCTLRQ